MAESKFNIINYLAGMTGFVFDKDVLQRIALDCGVSEIENKWELTQEDKDRCLMALLCVVLNIPSTTASHTSKHGEWQEQNGVQVITEKDRERAIAHLKWLAHKYDDKNLLELLEELEDMGATLQWMP